MLEMLVGLPGCGKTTYAKSTGYKVFSSDQIRIDHGISGHSKEDNCKVFEILHKSIRESLKNGENCVYDATNLSMKNRRAFLDSIQSIPCKKVCVLFVTPIEECKRRNRTREGAALVPDEVYERMLRTFNPPYYYEGFDEIRIIDNCKDYKRPWDWKRLTAFNQDNKHHSLSLGMHMIRTSNNLDVPVADLKYNYLVEAALFHDIGKLYTKSFTDYKGNKTEEAHYYGHEHYGAYVYLVSAIKANNPDILHTAVLIDWHMKPFTGWIKSNKARKRDRELIGEDMYHDIMLLHKADRSAH